MIGDEEGELEGLGPFLFMVGICLVGFIIDFFM